jgi:hypothetical protein
LFLALASRQQNSRTFLYLMSSEGQLRYSRLLGLAQRYYCNSIRHLRSDSLLPEGYLLLFAISARRAILKTSVTKQAFDVYCRKLTVATFYNRGRTVRGQV